MRRGFTLAAQVQILITLNSAVNSCKTKLENNASYSNQRLIGKLYIFASGIGEIRMK